MTALVKVQPGDVLAVRGSRTGTGWWIRLGAALAGKPDLDAHVAVAHHHDKAGTLWCVEGRPGGVGWRDARAYLASGWTVTNTAQPKTAAQRTAVCEAARELLGTPYDWTAIMQDAATDLRLWRLWSSTVNGQVPGHVVCSSLAAWAYVRAGLPSPVEPSEGGWRDVQPADWTTWCLTRGWEMTRG